MKEKLLNNLDKRKLRIAAEGLTDLGSSKINKMNRDGLLNLLEDYSYNAIISSLKDA